MDPRASDSSLTCIFDELSDALRESEASLPPTLRRRSPARELGVRIASPPLGCVVEPPPVTPTRPIERESIVTEAIAFVLVILTGVAALTVFALAYTAP